MKKTEKKEMILDKRILKIAAKLRKLRKEAGYKSYEQFAWDNGINRVQYYRVEKGQNITEKTLLKILDIHKISKFTVVINIRSKTTNISDNFFIGFRVQA